MYKLDTSNKNALYKRKTNRNYVIFQRLLIYLSETFCTSGPEVWVKHDKIHINPWYPVYNVTVDKKNPSFW